MEDAVDGSSAGIPDCMSSVTAKSLNEIVYSLIRHRGEMGSGSSSIDARAPSSLNQGHTAALLTQ
ncbi:MAG TPA: hypothetical protein VGG34_11620 [Opitutaceae bacterium]|jgi:hypothetical protein